VSAFTLSGFLITTLLLDEHRRATHRHRPFLLRRARRLLRSNHDRGRRRASGLRA
jgi:peptidoglycan/LPS O-acetylase OafA/YrhL